MTPDIPGVWVVFIRQRKPGQESIADTKKFRYPSLPLANIQTLRIRDANPVSYCSDDKIKYLSLDKPIKIRVLATQINQLKPIPSFSK